MLKIYINTWGNYNEHGAENGRWITLPMDKDELSTILKTTAEKMNDHDPEWFVNGYEWEGESLFPVDEMSNYNELNELCQTISQLDEYNQEKLAAIIEYTYSDIKEALDNLDSYIFYPNTTLEDVAYDLVNECYDLPEFALRYFDYAAFARDLHFDYYYEVNNGVLCYC